MIGDNSLSEIRIPTKDGFGFPTASPKLFCLDEIVHCQCVFIRADNSKTCLDMITNAIKKEVNIFLANSKTAIPEFCDFYSVSDGPEWTYQRNEANQSYPFLGRNSGYVILKTSGSSGTPKYVIHQSFRMFENSRNAALRLGISASTSLLLTVPQSHMFGLGVGVLTSCLTGAELCLIDRPNIIKIISGIQRYLPDFVLTTPVLCRMLLKFDGALQYKPRFIVAGEQMTEEEHTLFSERFGETINLYGSTEMGVIATSSANERERKSVLTPLSGTNVKLIDRRLHVKTNTGFRAYLNELSCQIMLPNDWFDTRDFGDLRSENIILKGRSDNVIVRNGLNVTLEEIELQFRDTIQGVKQVSAMMATNHLLTNKPQLIVVYSSELPHLTPITCGCICQEKLASHYRADLYLRMNALPTTASGKIDRNAIAEFIELITTNS